MVDEQDNINLDDGEGLFFEGEEETVDLSSNTASWKVMVVDDDEEVHAVTRMALGNLTLEEKPIQLISAHSGQEAKDTLLRHPDTAIILLDVVMETDHAGLDVAQFVRSDLGNPFIRIILRTGQPGQAPEKRVIDNYEINDYKEKTELTTTKLYTAMCSALRAYRDLMLIEQHKMGLWRIIKASSALFVIDDYHEFASAVLQQLTGLLRLDDHAVLCKNASGLAAKINSSNDMVVLAGIGDFANVSTFANDSLPVNIQKTIALALEQKKNLYFDDYYVAYFKTSGIDEHVLYIQNSKGVKLSTFDREIIELFCSHVASAYTMAQNNKNQ